MDFFFNQEVDMDKLREDWNSKVTRFRLPSFLIIRFSFYNISRVGVFDMPNSYQNVLSVYQTPLLQGRDVLVEILKKRARSKAAKARVASGKRKGQGQGWRRGSKKKQRL